MRAWPLLLLAACSGAEDPDPSLLDPETCADCHPSHVQQWQGSMHAYSADDPIFRAMNEAAVQSGEVDEDFCVTCHAPVAVQLGETRDGSNLDELPAHLRGVTCVFCHQLDGVEGEHGGAVSWSFDGIMKGGIADPIESSVHGSAYSELLARDAPASSDACGACHDIVLPSGLHLEKSYAEWQDTTFSSGVGRQGCVHCHLPSSEGQVAAVPDAPVRRVHDHRMPAVDVALIAWPDKEGQRSAVQDLLDRSLRAELCVASDVGGANISLTLENILAGHDFPSGASHDRRVWVDLTATADGVEVLRSGAVPEGTPMVEVQDAGRVELHDLARRSDGGLSHSIVDAVRLEERALPGTPDPVVPHARTFSWPVVGAVPDRVEVAVRLRPIGLDVLQHHADEGRLDLDALDPMPTFTLGSTALVWRGPLGTCVD